MGGWVGRVGRRGGGGGIPKTIVSRFKFQDGGGVGWEEGGRRKVIVLIVATDSRLWFKFQVSSLKDRDFTPVHLFPSTLVPQSHRLHVLLLCFLLLLTLLISPSLLQFVLKARKIHKGCSTRENAQVLLPPAVEESAPYRQSSQGYIKSQRWIQQMFVPQFLPNRVQVHDLLLTGLIVIAEDKENVDERR